MRYIFLLCVFSSSISLQAQVMTLIAKHQNGLRDTVSFGFRQNATLDEDITLGEENIFMNPVNEFEGRILQRDSSDFSCAMLLDETEIYYTNNFDSKKNFRDITDTSLHNRFFEIWYSDHQIDSMEMICDIPIRSFLYGAHLYPFDCDGIYPPPAGLLVIYDDTIKHLKYHLEQGLGIKEHIFITNPNLLVTGVEEPHQSNNENRIKVYPNPAFDLVNYQHSLQQDIKEIFLYDVIGKLLDQKKIGSGDCTIDLNRYIAGTYIVIFVLENNEHIVKVLLKR